MGQTTHDFLLESEDVMVEELVELLIGVIDTNCGEKALGGNWFVNIVANSSTYAAQSCLW